MQAGQVVPGVGMQLKLWGEQCQRDAELRAVP